jgi:mannose-6-phosphate isomerase-like protein (cupin superfamily)
MENPLTGERVEIRRSGKVLELDHWWPVGHRTPRHRHPKMEERWLVVAGKAAFRIDGVESLAGPGERLAAAAGVSHESWNAGEEPVQVRVEMRPGLRWAEFVERLFRLDDPAQLGELLRQYPDEIAI